MASPRSSRTASASYDLDNALGFWLHLVHHKVRAAAERELAAHGLTPEHWAILVRLWREDDVSQMDLVASTFRDKPSVSRLLDGLEAAGYVGRARNPGDRRAHRILLTAKGRALEAELVPKMTAFVARWTKDIPARDIATTVRTLRALYAALASDAPAGLPARRP